MIIGIGGPTASGKTTVARMLEEEYDAFRIRYSSILSEMAKERGLDADDKATLQNLYLSERELRGEDFLAKELEDRVQKITGTFVVIEGNRRLVDVETLRRIANARGQKLLLIFIDASPDVRFERYNSRQRSHGEPEISRSDFETLEKNGAENEIDALREIFSQEGLRMDTDTKSQEVVLEEVRAYILRHTSLES